MRDTDIAEPKSLERALNLARKCFDIILDDAPVMMHAIDETGQIIKVNRRWLDRLGYERYQVLGRKSFDFDTKESRLMAVKDTLPLLRRVGSARSVGHQFVRKDGRVLDVLIDAQTCPLGCCFAYAAIRDGRDLEQWEQASTTIRTLMQCSHIRYLLEESEASENHISSNPDPPQWLPKVSSQPAPSAEVLGSLLEATQDVSTGLRSLVHLQEQWLESREERQLELLTLAKSIEKTLAELVGLAAEIPRQ